MTDVADKVYLPKSSRRICTNLMVYPWKLGFASLHRVWSVGSRTAWSVKTVNAGLAAEPVQMVLRMSELF